MIFGKKLSKTLIRCNDSYAADSLERTIEKLVANNEPIDNVVTPLYTERADGVLPSTDPRTDRYEVALDAMDKVSRSLIAKRDEKPSNVESDETA